MCRKEYELLFRLPYMQFSALTNDHAKFPYVPIFLTAASLAWKTSIDNSGRGGANILLT